MNDLETKKSEGTVFWLDGWDEIASTLDGRSSEQLYIASAYPKLKHGPLTIYTRQPPLVRYGPKLWKSNKLSDIFELLNIN